MDSATYHLVKGRLRQFDVLPVVPDDWQSVIDDMDEGGPFVVGHWTAPILYPGWLEVWHMITRRQFQPDGPYYEDFDTTSPLKELPYGAHVLDESCIVTPGMNLWLAPNGDVWLASKDGPRDPNRKLVGHEKAFKR
jgi:hypothetical protein